MNAFTFSSVWKATMGLFTFTLAGLSSVAKAFASIAAVAEATAGEYEDDARHARQQRAVERTKLLASQPALPVTPTTE